MKRKNSSIPVDPASQPEETRTRIAQTVRDLLGPDCTRILLVQPLQINEADIEI
ncbi:MAG: hypothetical protein HQM02_01375, partial [Magnetococcales bacterium]|nr:hypothetical protein [Magnetococcales bacterium]